MDLGNLNWSVEVDTSDLSRAEREMEGTREAAEGGRRATERMGREAETAGRRTRTATQQMDRGFRDVQRAIQLATGALAAFGAQRVFRSIINEVQQLETNLLRTEQLIQTTGRTATRSAQQMHQQARQLALATLQSTEGVMQAQQTLLTFRNITGDVFDQAIEGAVDLSAALGIDLNSAVMQVAKALEDPVRGMSALTRSGTVFTDAQRDMVRELVETNRTMEAQQFILGELAAQYGGVAAAEAQGLAGAQDTLNQRMQEAQIAFGAAIGGSEALVGSYNTASSVLEVLTEHMETVVRVLGVMAAMAAGRAVQAIGALVAAKAGLTAGTLTLTGALTGLRTVMMTLFGPVGLIAGAAAALYTFREELGLVGQEATNTARRINQLTEAISTMTATELASNLEKARMEMRFLVDQGTNLRRVLRDMEPGDTWDGRTYEQLRAQLSGIREDAIVARDGVRELESALERAQTPAEGAKIELEELDDIIRKVDESTGRAASAASGYSEALESLRRRIKPGYAEAERFAQGLNTVNLALAAGRISMGEYAELVQLLQREMQGAGDSAGELADRTHDSVDDMARAWERASDDIDRAFADAFQGALDSFDDFADRLLDGFKRLLAELAYQATLRPIVVGFTAQMGGALGIPGMGGAGAPSLTGGIGQVSSFFTGNSIGAGISSGANAAYNFISGGNIYGTPAGPGIYGNVAGISNTGPAWLNNPAGVSNISYGLQSFGGSYVGTELGSSLTGRTANSNYGAMAGSIAGSFLPIPGGTFIGATIGGFLDSAFGSGGSDLDIAMRRSASVDNGHGWDHGIVAEGALGAVGFDEDGSHEVADLWDVDEAKQLVQSIAQLDNAVASLAGNADELEAMREAVQGHYGETSNPDQVVDRLTSRYDQALAALGGDFGEFVRGLEGDINEVVAQAQAGRQAFAILSEASTHLNLRFDDSADGAYQAAASLAEMAGGVQALAAMQEAYYQAYFTEAERAARLQEDLTKALAELGLQLPETRDGFRELVEAQDLNTESGRETYLALLQLAGGFDQLQTQLESLSGALGGVDLSGVRSAYEQLQSSIAAEQKILRDAHQATTSSINSNMRTVQESMRDTERAARSLRGAMDTMSGQAAVDQGMRRNEAQLALRGILASGGLGDQGELERALSVVSEPSEDLFGSFEDYQRDFFQTAHVIDQLDERAGKQLTTEERSLRALEQQLEQADLQFEREMAKLDETLSVQTAQLEAEFGQLDWLQTVNGSVMSVEDAIRNLNLASSAASSAAISASSSTQRSANVAAGLDAEGNPLLSGATGVVADAYRDILGRDPDASGFAYYEASGRSAAQIRAELAASEEAKRYRETGIPGFANGGYHLGGARIVGERGPELEVTGPSRVVSNHDTKKLFDIEPLLREVSELRSELRASQRAIAEHTSKSARALERDELRKRQEEVV